MTYSNTKKANIQANWKVRAKNGLIAIILLVIIVSSLSNVINQYKTLVDAQKINNDLELKNAKISQEINDLKQKTEYASTSAYRQRRARQFLGLGNSSDRWIIFPKLEGNTNIGQKINESGTLPKYIQWWERFTK
jgi:cell division protein FtsB